MEKILCQVIRFIFIGINIFFFFVGLAIFSTGIYLVTVGVTYSYVTDSYYLSGAVIIMLCGVVTSIVAIVGIIGGACKWWIVLLVYFFMMLIVIILEIISGSIGFAYKKKIGEVNDKLMIAIRDYRDPSNTDYNADVNSFVDTVQSTFKCCGVNETGSWLSLNILYITRYGFPSSCECSAPADDCTRLFGISIYNKGCNTSFYNFVEKNSVTIGSLGFVFGLVEISGLILAMMLCWILRCSRDNTHPKQPNNKVLLI